jgi:hypothetical protein
MGIECRNEKSSFWCQQWRWPKLLRLAEAHGWQPQGTSQPPEDAIHFPGGRWDPSSYTSNDGQIVSAADARALANALELALPNIPDHDALAKYRRPDGGIGIAPTPPPASDADWFSGAEAKAYVTEFIAFCRQGTFRVY